ncbi:hypothetical protein [Actinomycetospora atypica]|uniref:Uncharacterized protein n=1 Tax=Actinomycetospora atypica TaxID=1290095 RepID=A0ABV9YJ26_9PSEU
MIGVDQIDPGDLLLVTPKPNEPLGHLITRLDGSAFSHSALALGGGRVASARAWVVGDGTDLGGIRFDRVEDFWAKKQSVYRLAVLPDVARGPALERVRRLVRPGDDGEFSLPKILIVAIALASWEPGLDDEAARTLRRLAVEAARAFEELPDDRSFFCAELVAHAYGRTFGVPALTPRNPVPAPPTREGVLDTVLERVTSVLTDERARAAVDRLLDGVGTTLSTFLDEAARRILRSPVSALAPDTGRFRGRLTPDKQEFPDAEQLPRALVTPRMLLDASWTARHTQRVDGDGAPPAPDDAGRTRPCRELVP